MRAVFSFSAGRSEATARGFDVNRMPSVAVGTELEEEEDDPAAAAALSSSPNDDSGGSFPFDLSAHGGHLGTSEAAAEAALAGGGERSSSRASDDDEGASARKKLRLSKDQSAFLEESFKEHSTLNPVSVHIAEQPTHAEIKRCLICLVSLDVCVFVPVTLSVASRSRRWRWRSSSISCRAKWRCGSRTAEQGAHACSSKDCLTYYP